MFDQVHLAEQAARRALPAPVPVGMDADQRHEEGRARKRGLLAPGRREAGAYPPSPSSAGLVGQATSVTLRLPTFSVRQAIRELNRTRRIRRMRRVVISAADATRDIPGFRCRGIFVTLTCADDAAWSVRDISAYVRAVREWLRRRGIPCRYQWVIELTRRGRPHYHVLFWLPVGIKLPKPDASGQWSKGLTRIELARRPVGYLVKYATKGNLADSMLPRGARL